MPCVDAGAHVRTSLLGEVEGGVGRGKLRPPRSGQVCPDVPVRAGTGRGAAWRVRQGVLNARMCRLPIVSGLHTGPLWQHDWDPRSRTDAVCKLQCVDGSLRTDVVVPRGTVLALNQPHDFAAAAGDDALLFEDGVRCSYRSGQCVFVGPQPRRLRVHGPSGCATMPFLGPCAGPHLPPPHTHTHPHTHTPTLSRSPSVTTPSHCPL